MVEMKLLVLDVSRNLSEIKTQDVNHWGNCHTVYVKYGKFYKYRSKHFMSIVGLISVGIEAVAPNIPKRYIMLKAI